MTPPVTRTPTATPTALDRSDARGPAALASDLAPGGVRAVATTGIYCRPGCRARPHPHNVSAFPSPVAAEAAGYRSCLRCRPDRHLAITSVDGVPVAVAQALAAISDGYLDRFDEEALARRVGYSTRQLRRLFEQHVGATPSFVARSRRAHFARRLLDETDLAMPLVAGAAGFGSVRQMNRVVEAIFGFGPAALRHKRHRGDVLVADGGLRLRLPFVAPFDRAAVRAHLVPRVTPGVEMVDGSMYRRTLAVCGNPGVLEIDLAEHPERAGATHLGLTAHLPTFDSIIDDVARVRTMFGLDDDVTAAEQHLESDPVLAPIVQRQRGLRVIGGWDRFETAVRIVAGQQVSVAAATTMTARIAARHGRPLPGTVLGLDRLFPTADALVELAGAGLGMPEARVASIRALAGTVLDGSLDLHADAATLREQLLTLPGIGSWTAEMILMRVMRDPDAFPATDLGLRHALGVARGDDGPVPAAVIEEHSDRWRPHRALAAQHLWSSLCPRDETPPKERPR